eukprot:CAMPEP_0201665786 /NCGR_PEP_ID=MMETSP0494-20130426/6824_1 /ASSEMBLY_ACC=CAM_ASM_000839 /TAXON_ID=420259 /ORGANISM="Thalassiosira gravida, Strain GMp14c1" /LENGTH=129 /DNA_ID=CAMNT_0048144813 /DNA_START=283 /DNA_END=671 /DNA_ORIENTATION=-
MTLASMFMLLNSCFVDVQKGQNVLEKTTTSLDAISDLANSAGELKAMVLLLLIIAGADRRVNPNAVPARSVAPIAAAVVDFHDVGASRSKREGTIVIVQDSVFSDLLLASIAAEMAFDVAISDDAVSSR